MGVLALLVLLMLAAQARGGSKGANATAATTHAAHAHHRAKKAADKAAATNLPEDHAAAAQAATQAAAATRKAQATTTRASTTPAPWPQVVPKGLPAWPGGWEPLQPPPKAVVDRAWQLLPKLWGRGSGAIATEQTAGQWVTYKATPMGNGVKGVTAWRVKPGAQGGANA